MPEGTSSDSFLEKVAHELLDRFEIVHPTIQIEKIWSIMGVIEKELTLCVGCTGDLNPNFCRLIFQALHAMVQEDTISFRNP